MLISFSKKFIFIHNPKVAGTSIKKALEKYQHLYINILTKKYQFHKNIIIKIIKSIPEPLKNDCIKSLETEGHAAALEIKNILSKEIFDSYFKFGFARNPWDIEISRYYYILSAKNHRHYKTVNQLKNFDKYLEWRISIKDIKKQKDFFTDEKGNIIVDYIGKFETLNNDFNYIANKLKLENVALPHKNQSQHRNYREYYNNHAKKIGEELFKDDIEFFNYDF